MNKNTLPPNVPKIESNIKKQNRDEPFYYTTSYYKGYKDEQVFVRIWKNVEEAKGILLVAHSIGEHSLLYDEFAKELNKAGYIVVVPDLRAHGKTAGEVENCGKYDGNFFQDCVLDLIKFADWMFKRFDLPLAIMGVGLGSFIAQSFAQNYHRHQALILVGSGYYPPSRISRVHFSSMLTQFFKGEQAPADKAIKLTFGWFENNFPDKNFHTHDKKIYERNQQDPYYGRMPTAKVCRSLADGMLKVFNGNNMAKMDLYIPILIENGQNDTIATASPTNVDKLLEQFKYLDFKNVESKIWEHGRHDILQETFRKKVFAHIIDFLDKNLEQ